MSRCLNEAFLKLGGDYPLSHDIENQSGWAVVDGWQYYDFHYISIGYGGWCKSCFKRHQSNKKGDAMKPHKLFIAALTVGMMLAFTWGAFARTNHGGRWARTQVGKYFKKRGWNLSKVHAVRMSKSGRSTQVVAQRGTSVYRLNVLHRTGKVSATRTGLISQAAARTKSFRYLTTKCQVNRGPIVENAGLSTSGKSYRYIGSDSATSYEPNFAVYLTVKKGKPNNFTRTSTR